MGRKEITWIVDVKTGCWNCNSHAPDSHGYPRNSFKGKHEKLSRVMYKTYKGPIPDGLVIRHTCDNRMCINPNHLLTGTIQDNLRDMYERNPGRGRSGNSVGLTAEKVVEMRKRYSAGGITCKKLGEEYGTHRSNVEYIVKRKTWKHI